MADIESIYKAIEQDPALRQILADLAKQDFSTEQIAAALAAAGIEVEPGQVEEALQEYQKKCAEQIAFEDVDPDQLKAIVGGAGDPDCDKYFKRGCGPLKQCTYAHLCDEYYNFDEFMGS